MAKRKRLYLAVDVGGTKILAALVDASGRVLRRKKCATPRDGSDKSLCRALRDVASCLVRKAEAIAPGRLAAMGVGVPGVVDPEEGLVLVAPNLGLKDLPLANYCQETFGVPVAIGNDCDIGILGEKWLGAARGATSAVGILVGTGIGGGFIQGARVWHGARGAASEIGHIVMEIGGPLCGCGNRGCLEALASRTAMERDLRAAIAAGRPTVLTRLLEREHDVIRSSLLRQAIDEGDSVVVEVLRHASEVLGHACLTINHLLDPEVIVLGGGVIEACSDFMVPIIERIVADDRLVAGRPGGEVLVSSLGDDAVILGATALARLHVGENPFKKRFTVAPAHTPITRRNSGALAIGGKTFKGDFYVTASGKAKRHKMSPELRKDGSRRLGREHLGEVCRGGPQMLFIAGGPSGKMKLSAEARLYLEQRAIEWHVLPLSRAVEAYNDCDCRKGALVHVGDE